MFGFARLAAVALAFAIASPAFADVKAFNAAVAAGDYKTAAAEAETVWKTWNRSDPDTAIVAREFGFAAMASGRYEFARDLGRFLGEQGASLAKPDTMPLASAVLHRAAAYRLNPGNDERAALRAALAARTAEAGLDMTSVLAWETLYQADFTLGDFDNTGEDAAGAAAFMARDPRLIMRRRAAEVRSASAYFTASRNSLTRVKNQYYAQMVGIHDSLSDDIDAAANPSTRAQLWQLKWMSEAWALAMYSFLSSSYTQTGSVMNLEENERHLRQPKLPPFAEDPATAALPVCEGKFEGPRPQYPPSKILREMVGSVIVHIETAADGRVTKAETLASVPYEEFSAAIIDKAKQWTFKPSSKKNGESCRLNSRNHVFRAQFRIQ